MSASPAFAADAVSAFVERSDLPVSFADVRSDEPLVYVNPAFERLTGHAAADCLGRNCRFLQGPSSEPAAVARVREGIDAREYRLTSLLNYRADGTEFTNGLLVGPLRGADGETLALVGMQWDVGEILTRRQARRRETHWERQGHGSSVRLDHFESLVRLAIDASRERDPGGDPMRVVERLVALAHPHQYPPHDRLPNWTQAESLLPFLVRPYGPGSLDGLRVEERPDVVAVDVAYALSLAVHAFARATWSRSSAPGQVASDVGLDILCRTTSCRGESVLELLWRVSDLRGADAESTAAPARAELDVVAGLVERLGGAFEFELDRDRLDAALRLPNRPFDVLDDVRASSRSPGA